MTHDLSGLAKRLRAEMTYSIYDQEACKFCRRWAWSANTIAHADDCLGQKLLDALDRLAAPVSSDKMAANDLYSAASCALALLDGLGIANGGRMQFIRGVLKKHTDYAPIAPVSAELRHKPVCDSYHSRALHGLCQNCDHPEAAHRVSTAPVSGDEEARMRVLLGNPELGVGGINGWTLSPIFRMTRQYAADFARRQRNEVLEAVVQLTDRVSEAHKAIMEGRKNAAEDYLMDAIQKLSSIRAMKAGD